MDYEKILGWALAPVIGIVGWTGRKLTTLDSGISDLDTRVTVLENGQVAVQKSLDKIDSRQEELIDFLLREKSK